MPTINPTQEEVETFERTTPDASPIVMLNLLKFRERADHADGGTGREAYQRYTKAVMPLLWATGGQPLWMGEVRAGLIAPAGESWDEALLVHYPSRAAFLSMVKSEAYQKIMHHRTAALADSRLFELRAVPLPKWILGAARSFTRLKSRLGLTVG
jgi:uncharacterized protein (DUF1330 family)